MRLTDAIRARLFVNHLKQYNLIKVEKDYYNLVLQYKSLSSFIADCVKLNNIKYLDFPYELQKDTDTIIKVGIIEPKVFNDIRKHDKTRYYEIIMYLIEVDFDVKLLPTRIAKDLKIYAKGIAGGYELWDQIFEMLS